MNTSLSVGNLKSSYLKKLLDTYCFVDERIIVGPKIGEDAAVIDFGDRYLVATTDPITFATDEIGWYTLHINANDIATRGGRPKWLLATLLFPEEKTTEETVEETVQGVGGGGGSGLLARPFAIVEVTPEVTRVKSIVDEQKLALAGVLLIGWIALCLARTLVKIFGQDGRPQSSSNT